MAETTGRPDRFTRACFGTYILLGWILSGIGAVLPQLRDELGGSAGFYPSLPGAALLIIGLIAMRRGSASTRTHRSEAARATAATAVGVVALAITEIPLLSAAGMVVVAAMAAVSIRLMPAALTSHRPNDADVVITRANAWSSLASIVAPLAIGGAIEANLGWRVGLVAAPVVVAVVVLVLLRSAGSDVGAVQMPAPSTRADAADATVAPRLPWIDAWAILALSITVEFAFVYFASTFLREEVGMSNGTAAAGTAAFAVGMATSRFLAGSVRALRSASLHTHLAVTGAGFVMMWVVPRPATAVVGIAIAGFGTALLYPIGIGRLMGRFPHSVEQGATRGALASGAALLGSPALLGALRAISNVRVAYLSVPVLILVIVAINRRSEALAAPGR